MKKKKISVAAPLSPAQIAAKKANELVQAKRYKEAIDFLDSSPHTDRSKTIFLHLYGLAWTNLLEHEKAVPFFVESIKLNPLDPFPYFNIGNALAKNVQFDEAEKYYNLALTLDENCVDALVGMGVVNFQKSNYEACEEFFTKSLKFKPDNAQVITNLGNTYFVQGRYDEALSFLNRALALNPENPMARTNRGLVKLGRYDFETGWADYENRFYEEAFSARKFTHIPQWNGDLTKPGNVLIWCEQGLGDEIMFASIFNDLKGAQCTLFVESDKRLLRAFQASFPHLKFIPKGIGSMSGVNYQLPLASLGALFRTRMESFERPQGGFLQLPFGSGLKPSTRAALEALPKPWIGVSWESYALTKNFRDRKSISAAEFAVYTGATSASLINLQYPNPHKHEKPGPQDIPTGVTTLPDLDLKNDIEELVALMKEMDNVITIGNSVAHLCGGFGIPAKVLLPSVPDWRWGHSGEQSVWYESLHLLRNPSADNWQDLLKTIAKAPD